MARSPWGSLREVSGQHFLTPWWAARLVADAAVAPDDLVVDLGAGRGALVRALLAARARVIAVELDPRLLDDLRARYGHHPDVRIVAADARTVGLPRRPFRVVANLPFASGTAIVRHLARAPGLVRADVVLQREVARRLAHSPTPSGLTLRPGRRIAAGAFRPRPSVDAAVLTITRVGGTATPARRRSARAAR